MDTFFKDYNQFTTFNPDGFGKSTLFENDHVLVGLNCLEPGHIYEKHAHTIQTRFYLVLEGKGSVLVGETEKDIQSGMVIWIPNGHTHKIINNGGEQLILLVGISPANSD